MAAMNGTAIYAAESTTAGGKNYNCIIWQYLLCQAV
jgi:hypothetical protein